MENIAEVNWTVISYSNEKPICDSKIILKVKDWVRIVAWQESQKFKDVRRIYIEVVLESQFKWEDWWEEKRVWEIKQEV